MLPGNCVRELAHTFDPISGWCLNGCGWREDGQSQYRRRARWEPTTAVDITEPIHPREN